LFGGIQKYDVACIKGLPNQQYYFGVFKGDFVLYNSVYLNNDNVYFDSMVTVYILRIF
jgi:hypothetical protein